MITAKESDVERRKQEMLDSLPPYYQESPEANAVMHGNASEIERKRAEAQDLLDQMFVSTATWGLDYWDRVLDLPLAPRMSIENRRSRIIAKLNGSATATSKNLIDVVNAYTINKNATIQEVNSEYRLIVNFEADSPVDMDGVSEALEELKPAHLDYGFKQTARSTIFLASVLQSGEEITVYPWSPESIELHGSAYMGSYSYEYDTTSVYPKGV